MPGSPTRIEYYFSFISLYSYIGSRALRALVERRGLDVVYKPVDLMAVFDATGGLPVKQRSIARQAYRLVEMQRWREIRGIPLVLQPRFYPANPARGHRMLLAALRERSRPRLPPLEIRSRTATPERGARRHAGAAGRIHAAMMRGLGPAHPSFSVTK